ncbi:glutathione S-transferase [Congregibacter brevis]|uniref:Glutathione S-transferase n=1 Tax=Congregibacter brevis TaxID=3081201 RepID=A0ABZ0II30_9GAMM|nr:glutathione S-transferase [Congregibacter sp. IMCC45268]
MAVAYSGAQVELREVILKDKPAAMLAASQKGTVPVLVLADGGVIDESIDVMRWALSRADPDGWLPRNEDSAGASLIAENDGSFKTLLDKYKYADRHPEHDSEWYRDEACEFLEKLEQCLKESDWLSGSTKGFADIAIFPFIRQFAGVDREWFDQSPYPALRAWLDKLLGFSLFTTVMEKYPQWAPEQPPEIFPEHR